MAWDSYKLAFGVVEEFATVQLWTTHERVAVELGRWAVLDGRHRERSREYARDRRGGLKGYSYNDARWRGTRPATRYVQLDLPYTKETVMREKLPVDRDGVTQKFTIITRKEEGGEENGGVMVEEIDIYLTANIYPHDYVNETRRGKLGEIFLRIGKAGHTEAIYGEWAKNASHALQCGISVDELFRKHVGTRFDPYGATTNATFKRCTSPLDLVSRWILLRYGSAEAKMWISSMNQKKVVEEQP
jgi:hypothetical protein